MLVVSTANTLSLQTDGNQNVITNNKEEGSKVL
jgi:hypothetical protein